MKRTLGFATVILLIAVICAVMDSSSSHGMTNEKEISVFVIDNIDVIKSSDTAQILALSDELTLFDANDEYIAFTCGASGIGPDGTYYGCYIYISFDSLPHEMSGCNEYYTTYIAENIYYFEYIVY